jgi:hypothetical protein
MTILRRVHENGDRQSLVKYLISLRPIAPGAAQELRSAESLFRDPIPPVPPVDQFPSYLTKKLQPKRWSLPDHLA